MRWTGKVFLVVVLSLLLALLLPSVVWADDDNVESSLQYKSIVLGVLIDPDSVPLSDATRTRVRDNFIDMITTTINNLNNNTFQFNGNNNSHSSIVGAGILSHQQQQESVSSYINNGNQSSLRDNNVTRTSSISVVILESIFDTFEDITEISVLLTMLNCEDSHQLNGKVTQIYGPIVHIAITEAGCPRLDTGSSIMIPLIWQEKNADMIQLLIDLRKDKVLPRWKEAVIIHDKQSGEGVISAFGKAFISRNNFDDVAQTLYNTDSMSLKSSFPDQVEDILNTYVKSSPGKFIVITSSWNVNRVLEVARRIGYLSIVKQWIFITPDPTGPEFVWNYIESRIIDDGVNIAFIMNSSANSTANFPNPVFCNTESLLVLLSDVVESLAVWELELYYQVSNEEWDIIKPLRADRVINITETIKINLSDKVLSVCDKNSSTWNLRAAENGRNGKQVFEVGWWNPITGLRMTDDLLPHVTGGFRSRNINVASMHFPPWQIITRDEEGNVTYSGLMFEVINHMSKDLNFTYTVMEPREGEMWGHIQSDGAWSGMMKMVAENKVVIAAAAFTVTPERSLYINFTQVIEREAYGFMVNRPEELSRVLLFAAPFSGRVWICIVITVILVAPILHAIHRFSYYYKYHKKVDERGLFKLKNCYWYIYGSLLQQGGIHLPEAISGRMLIGFWWLFVIVTVTTYSGNLVAFLTFPKVESPVNTVEDLTHHRGVETWGFLAGSVIEDHLMRSKDKEFEILYRKAIKHPALNQTVLDMVSKSQHAYIDWKIVLLTQMREALKITGRCEYIIGAETFFEEKIALAVPKNSPYLPIFNKQISQMLQTGLIKKWKSRYWPGKDKCSLLTVSAGNRKVGIGDMQGCFYLLCLGFLIAVIVLVVEFLIFRRQKLRMINTLKVLVGGNHLEQYWQQKQFPFLH